MKRDCRIIYQIFWILFVCVCLIYSHWHGRPHVWQGLRATPPLSGIQTDCPSGCDCNFVADYSLDLKCDRAYNATVMEEFFTKHKDLTSLKYHDSYLTTVPQELCNLKQLKDLNLNKNNISFLQNNQFSCLTALENINLDYNAIVEIGNYSFAGCPQLSSISMRHNGMKTIQTGAFLHKELISLFELNFEYNELTEGDFWPFLMPSLSYTNLQKPLFLNVSLNKIYRLVNTVGLDIHDLPYVKTLSESLVIDFRSNQIRKLSDVNFVKLLNITDIWDPLKFWNMGFFFTNNPFDCDCDLYYLLEAWRPWLRKFVNWGDRSLLEFKCAWPPRAAGTVIINTTLSNFQCQVKELCPAECICWHTPGNATMNVHCTGRGLTHVPYTSPNETNIHLHLASNDIRILENRSYFSNVSLMDISMCGLQSFASNLFDSLLYIKEFFLNDNDIREFPIEMFRTNFTALTEIHLYNNPVTCSCWTLYLKSWIYEHHDVVIHPDGVVCHSGGNCPGVNVIDVRDSQFMCGIEVTLILEIFSGCLGFVVLNAVLISIYRRQLQIRIYYAFKRKIAMPTASANANHTLDILSIGAEENQREVTQIMDCVRNVLTDPKIFNNIDDVLPSGNTWKETCELLKETKCIMINISRDFLSDAKCNFIFNAAFDAFIQDRNMALMPVLININCKEDILGHNMDADLKYFIKKAECLYFNTGGEVAQFENNLRDQFTEFQML